MKLLVDLGLALASLNYFPNCFGKLFSKVVELSYTPPVTFALALTPYFGPQIN
jgi:hypothetical protein